MHTNLLSAAAEVQHLASKSRFLLLPCFQRGWRVNAGIALTGGRESRLGAARGWEGKGRTSARARRAKEIAGFFGGSFVRAAVASSLRAFATEICYFHDY